MRYELYYKFYETLRRFAKDENFVIKFNIFNEKCTLKFDKKLKLFVVQRGLQSYQKAENVYEIIRNYVVEKISNEQKEVFHKKLKNKNDDFITLDEREHEIFIELIKKFKEKLWEEPIFPSDIKADNYYQRILYGFRDSFASEYVIADLIAILKEFSRAFETGKISSFMWSKDIFQNKMYLNELEILQTESYIDIEEKNSIINIFLTIKFYEALKRAFYFDFDPDKNLVIRNELNKSNQIISFTEI